jgi:hypothetical protein
MPATRYVTPGAEGSVKVRERSLGNVSVVQMARAAASQSSCFAPSASYAFGIAAVMRSMGRLGGQIGSTN